MSYIVVLPSPNVKPVVCIACDFFSQPGIDFSPLKWVNEKNQRDVCVFKHIKDVFGFLKPIPKTLSPVVIELKEDFHYFKGMLSETMEFNRFLAYIENIGSIVNMKDVDIHDWTIQLITENVRLYVSISSGSLKDRMVLTPNLEYAIKYPDFTQDEMAVILEKVRENLGIKTLVALRM